MPRSLVKRLNLRALLAGLRMTKWIKRRRAKDLPDKCKVCGLLVAYERPADERVEADVVVAQKLDEYGLGRYAPRNITLTVGGPNETFFCAVANVKYWNQRKKPCPDWQFRLPGVSLGDHIAVYQAVVSRRLAVRYQWVSLAVAIIGALIAAAALIGTMSFE